MTNEVYSQGERSESISSDRVGRFGKIMDSKMIFHSFWFWWMSKVALRCQAKRPRRRRTLVRLRRFHATQWTGSSALNVSLGPNVHAEALSREKRPICFHPKNQPAASTGKMKKGRGLISACEVVWRNAPVAIDARMNMLESRRLQSLSAGQYFWD